MPALGLVVCALLASACANARPQSADGTRPQSAESDTELPDGSASDTSEDSIPEPDSSDAFDADPVVTDSEMGSQDYVILWLEPDVRPS